MVNYKSKYLKYKLKYKKYGGMQDNNQELISKDEIFEILQNRHNIKQLSNFMKIHRNINENKIDYIIDKFINLKQHVGIKNIKEVVNDVNFENINKSKLDHILIRQYIKNKINNNFNKFSKNDKINHIIKEINHIINIIKEINLDIFKEEDIEVINFFKEQVDELQLSYDMKEVILQKLNESYDNEVDSEKVYFLLKILNKNTNDKLQEDYIKLLKDKQNSKYLLSGHGSSLEDLFIVPDNIIIITTSPNNILCYSHPNTSNRVHCNKSFDKIEDFYKYNLSIDKSRIYYPGQIMRNMIFVFKNIWDNPFRYCHGGLISEDNYNKDVEQKNTENGKELMKEITKFHDFRLYSQNNQGFKEKNIKHKHNYSDELSNIIYNISHNLKFRLQEKNKKIILFLKACRKSNNNDVPIECNIEQMDTISNRTLELEPKLQLSRALSFSSNVTDLNLKQDFNIFLNHKLTHYDTQNRTHLFMPIKEHISYINYINSNDITFLNKNKNNKYTFSLKELCNFYKFLNLKKQEESNRTTEKKLKDDKKEEQMRQKIEKCKSENIKNNIEYKSCNCDKRALLRMKDYQKDGRWTKKDIYKIKSIVCCERHQENLPILDNTGDNTYISREPYTKDTVLTKKNPDFDGENQKESTATKRSIESKYKTTTKNPDFDGEKQKESTATKKSRKKPKPKNRTSKKRNSGKNNKTLMKI